MAASFPTSIKTFTTKASGEVIQPAHVNDLQDEVVALETALYTGAALTLKPSATNTYDLGTTTIRWRDLYLSGSALLGSQILVEGASTLRGQTRIGTAAASQPTADTSADELLIQGAANVGVSFLTDSLALGAADRNQTIAFGAAGLTALDAYIRYNTGTRALTFATGGTLRWTLNSAGALVYGGTSTAIYLYYGSATAYVGISTSAAAPGVLYFLSGATAASAKTVLDGSGNLYPNASASYTCGAVGGEWKQVIGGPGTSSLPSLCLGSTSGWTGQFFDTSSSVSQWNVGFSAAMGSGWATLLTLRNTQSGTAGPILTVPTTAAGTGGGGSRVTIGRNSSGLGAAGTLCLTDKAGTAYYLWVDAAGDLRINTSAPTETSGDTDGTVVGDQAA